MKLALQGVTSFENEKEDYWLFYDYVNIALRTLVFQNIYLETRDENFYLFLEEFFKYTQKAIFPLNQEVIQKETITTVSNKINFIFSASISKPQFLEIMKRVGPKWIKIYFEETKKLSNPTMKYLAFIHLILLLAESINNQFFTSAMPEAEEQFKAIKKWIIEKLSTQGFSAKEVRTLELAIELLWRQFYLKSLFSNSFEALLSRLKKMFIDLISLCTNESLFLQPLLSSSF